VTFSLITSVALALMVVSYTIIVKGQSDIFSIFRF